MNHKSSPKTKFCLRCGNVVRLSTCRHCRSAEFTNDPEKAAEDSAYKILLGKIRLNKIQQYQDKSAVVAEPSEWANDSVDAPARKNELKALADSLSGGETQEEGNDAIKSPVVMEGPKTMVEMFGGGKMLEEAGYFDAASAADDGSKTPAGTSAAGASAASVQAQGLGPTITKAPTPSHEVIITHPGSTVDASHLTMINLPGVVIKTSGTVTIRPLK